MRFRKQQASAFLTFTTPRTLHGRRLVDVVPGWYPLTGRLSVCAGAWERQPTSASLAFTAQVTLHGRRLVDVVPGWYPLTGRPSVCTDARENSWITRPAKMPDMTQPPVWASTLPLLALHHDPIPPLDLAHSEGCHPDLLSQRNPRQPHFTAWPSMSPCSPGLQSPFPASW
jgi:hypothetical protein